MALVGKGPAQSWFHAPSAPSTIRSKSLWTAPHRHPRREEPPKSLQKKKSLPQSSRQLDHGWGPRNIGRLQLHAARAGRAIYPCRGTDPVEARLVSPCRRHETQRRQQWPASASNAKRRPAEQPALPSRQERSATWIDCGSPCRPVTTCPTRQPPSQDGVRRQPYDARLPAGSKSPRAGGPS